MTHTYPPIQTYQREMLQVDEIHSLYLEQTGNPDGIPVLYLHGGPGAGLAPIYRSLFDPQKYRIIGFDQRGCGQSTPFGELRGNDTQSLLADIQLIRKHLGIKTWMLFGGSWGSTLALLAAIDDPQSVTSLVLRGIFLARQEDFSWYLNAEGGPAQIFPDYYQEFINPISALQKQHSVAEAYYQQLTHSDELSRMAAVKSWCMWEERIAKLHATISEHDLSHDVHRAISLALLECHYIKHGCFIEEDFILSQIGKIAHIPGTIVHGRYDMVCKLEGAHKLRQVWHNSQLLIVPESGHSTSEPLIAEAICQSTDAMARFLNETHK